MGEEETMGKILDELLFGDDTVTGDDRGLRGLLTPEAKESAFLSKSLPKLKISKKK